MREAPSIFESFNARALEPAQVARTFVPSVHYDRLAKRRHSLIIGPRGSGKTTLLKMLQPAALHAWQHERAAEFRSRVDFTGVFVSTDVSWGAQLDAIGFGKLDHDSTQRLGTAAFTTHVLRALVLAFAHRAVRGPDGASTDPRHVPLTPEAEIALARQISAAWQIDPIAHTLHALRNALSMRLLQVRTIGNRESLLSADSRAERLAAIEFLHLHFIEALSVGVELFEDLANTGSEKWALLFDELELAPRWILNELLRSLRSTDSRFLFKLSLSPYSEDAKTLETALSAMPGNDYDQIALWYPEKDDAQEFCEALWFGVVKERGLSGVSPDILLGSSLFETPRDEWQRAGTAYSSGSRVERQFINLWERDETFRTWLSSRGIDPRLMKDVPADERAAVLRKIAPLVVVREAFRAPDVAIGRSGQRSTRSRKKVILYTGARALFSVSEGNPRLLIGILDRVFDAWPHDSSPVPRSVQAREIQSAADRFSAMLRTIPAPPVHVGKSTRGLLSLIARIGDYFFTQVVKDDFNPDPPGTFIVDSHSSQDLVATLAVAVNAGAIIYVPDDAGTALLSSLKGKRFRLSYLLAAKYQLPIRLGRPISLNRVLLNEPVAGQQPLLSRDDV